MMRKALFFIILYGMQSTATKQYLILRCNRQENPFSNIDISQLMMKHKINIFAMENYNSLETVDKQKLFNLVYGQQSFLIGDLCTTMGGLVLFITFFYMYLWKINKEKRNMAKFMSDITRFLYSPFHSKTMLISYVILWITLLLPVLLFRYGRYWNLSGIFLNTMLYAFVLLLLNIILYKNCFYCKQNVGLQVEDAQSHRPIKHYAEDFQNRLDMVILFNFPYLIAFIVQMLRWKFVVNQINSLISKECIIINLTRNVNNKNLLFC